MPVFIGLDLAWTPHHETGVCILQGDARSVRLLRLDCCAATPDGMALKNLEDRLDALTCAYVAYHCWKHGPDGFRVFGCDEHGSIVTPRLVSGVTYARAQPSP